tara:strand:+ start:240 stop:533 length:294 start_codon:yes stop_codon:yes gene_type:complete
MVILPYSIPCSQPHPNILQPGPPLIFGAVWTSYLYYSAPRYLTAFLVNMAAAALAICFATATRYYLKRQNAKMDRGLATGKSGPTERQTEAGFRFLL